MTVSLEEQIAAVARASLRPVDRAAPEAGLSPSGDRHHRSGAWLAAAACLTVLLGLGALVAVRNGGGDTNAAEVSTTSSPSSFDHHGEGAPQPPWDLVGKPAPELVGTTADGSSVTLASMRGSWVVVNIFASWCTPCMPQQSELVALSENPTIEVVTVAFSPDVGIESITSDLRAGGVTWPVIAIDDASGTTLDGIGLPTTVVVNPEGVVTSVFAGSASTEELRAAVTSPVDGHGMVNGQLGALGWPGSNGMVSVPGIITFTDPAGNETHVDTNGSFVVSLMEGSYTLSGSSELFGAEGVGCVVEPSTVEVTAGATQVHNATCLVK